MNNYTVKVPSPKPTLLFGMMGSDYLQARGQLYKEKLLKNYLK
jgi:hypothetical protein